MIELRGVQKRYGKLTVLNGIDLILEKNRVAALIGPNASGKTTLLKCILGLVKPDRGDIWINGVKLNGEWEYRNLIGYMPQIARFPENLTVAEVVRLLEDLRNHPAEGDQQLWRDFGLEKEKHKAIRALSGGTRQKLSAYLAFRFQPEILVLDEPTAGLDPVSSRKLKEKILSEKQAGKTILLTSHILSEVEELADYIIFMLEGKILYHGHLADLKLQWQEHRLEGAIARLMEEVKT